MRLYSITSTPHASAPLIFLLYPRPFPLNTFTSVERVREVECVSCAIKSEIEIVRDEIMNLEDAIAFITTRHHCIRNSKTVDDKDTSNVSELQQ